MEIKNYKKRIVDKQIAEYLQLFGAVCIDGPKYCGKTWSSRYHANSEFLLQSKPNEDELNELVNMSPELILNGAKPRLIDEWQVAPKLWDIIRNEVDKTGEKGQFLLTGSSTPNREGILHSGAGRFGYVHLKTMSLYESGDSTGAVSLQDICAGKDIAVATGEVKLTTLAELIIRGGWPANLGLEVDKARKVVKEYIDLIINDDLYRLDGVKRDKQKMYKLLQSLARNESTTATNTILKKNVKDVDNEDIDVDTIASYLNALNKLFLLDNDMAFSTNIRSSFRLKQAEKRHFVDPSISCALLNLTVDKLIGDLKTFGFMFEALVERDLKIYANSFDAKVYHYQDYLNREIDAVIELEDGSWCAFEIKLGVHQIDAAALNLLKIKESIENDNGKAPTVLGVICGMSSYAYRRKDGVYVVPITALKN